MFYNILLAMYLIIWDKGFAREGEKGILRERVPVAMIIDITYDVDFRGSKAGEP